MSAVEASAPAVLLCWGCCNGFACAHDSDVALGCKESLVVASVLLPAAANRLMRIVFALRGTAAKGHVAITVLDVCTTQGCKLHNMAVCCVTGRSVNDGHGVVVGRRFWRVVHWSIHVHAIRQQSEKGGVIMWVLCNSLCINVILFDHQCRKNRSCCNIAKQHQHEYCECTPAVAQRKRCTETNSIAKMHATMALFASRKAPHTPFSAPRFSTTCIYEFIKKPSCSTHAAHILHRSTTAICFASLGPGDGRCVPVPVQP